LEIDSILALIKLTGRTNSEEKHLAESQEYTLHVGVFFALQQQFVVPAFPNF
jgi:hypothetical protein